MKKRSLKPFSSFLALYLAIYLLCPFNAAHADWLDEWWSNSNYGGYTPGSYATSQGRGYATAGSFNVRRQSTTSDYLVSIQRPSIKAGCGGIDGFLGAVAFVNDPNYLINKAQNIISAAPYIAFEMALKILNQQLAGSLQNALSVVDALNNININDCAAAKPISAAMISPFNNKGTVEGASEAWSSFYQDTGFSNLWTQSQNTINNTPINTPGGGANENDLVQGCPADLQAIATAPSIIEYLLNRYGYSDDVVEVVRGLFGDYRVTPTQAIYIDTCPSNEEGKKLELFWNGQGRKKRLSNDACVAMDMTFTEKGTTYSSIRDWVRTMLTEIHNNMLNKVALSADNQFFIEHIPSPVYLHMRNSTMTGSGDVSIDTYTNLCTAGFVYQTIEDLYGAVSEAIIKAKRIGSAQNTASSTCKVISMNSLIEGLDGIRNKLQDFHKQTGDEYTMHLLAHQALENNSRVAQEVSNLIQSKIAGAFGSSLAARISR